MPKALSTRTLLVDDRIGSREFAKPLKRLGCPAKVQRLPFADFAFDIHGPHGWMSVGVERKTVTEMLGAVGDSRFVGKQLPGLVKSYDLVILIVEGIANPDRHTGLLMSGKYAAGFGPGRHVYESYKKFQLTLALKAGVIIEPTSGFHHTMHLIHALYQWGTKPWDQHKAAYKVESLQADRLILDERTMRRQTFAQWPGIGWKYSAMVSEYFPSVKAASNATAGQWRKALKIATGTKRVMTIVKFLNGLETRNAKAT